MTRHPIRCAAAVAAISLPLVAGGTAHADDPSFTHDQVTALRAATARFHSLRQTLMSGRTDLHLCMDQMGEHYTDTATFGDGVLDPTDPEAMVYEHTTSGLKLVAVEWVSTSPGSVNGVPLHLNTDLGVYVLHAWVWKHNPAGMLQDFNPTVGNCP